MEMRTTGFYVVIGGVWRRHTALGAGWCGVLAGANMEWWCTAIWLCGMGTVSPLVLGAVPVLVSAPVWGGAGDGDADNWLLCSYWWCMGAVYCTWGWLVRDVCGGKYRGVVLRHHLALSDGDGLSSCIGGGARAGVGTGVGRGAAGR